MKILISLFLLSSLQIAFSQDKIIETGHFTSVVVSPHIEVEFRKGEKESVEVIDINEDLSKLYVDLSKKTLQLYLDDAKVVTKNNKHSKDEWNNSQPLYNGTVAKLLVTYKELDFCDLRGEEQFLFFSPIQQEDFKLAIYGESKVTINSVDLEQLKLTIYGSSHLEILEGRIDEQRILAYGESEVKSLEVPAKEVKVTSYGTGEYYVNCQDQLKVTSFGESDIYFVGAPSINKGINIGETYIRKFEE